MFATLALYFSHLGFAVFYYVGVFLFVVVFLYIFG